MSSINVVNSTFMFIDDNGASKPLIEFGDASLNKSRVPLHPAGEGVETIPRVLSGVMNKNKTLFEEMSGEEKLRYAAVSAIVLSEMMKSSEPRKIAAIGSSDAVMSFDLAFTAGKLNPDSELFLISNIIGGENSCLDAIVQVKQPPKFSMLFSDYDNTNLAENSFDIVVLCGEADFDKPYEVINEAVRIAKNGGLIVCCCSQDCLLESSFMLTFSQREEYRLNARDALITARAQDAWLSGNDIKAELIYTLDMISQALSLSDKERLRQYSSIVGEYAEQAVREHNCTLKQALITLREKLTMFVCGAENADEVKRSADEVRDLLKS